MKKRKAIRAILTSNCYIDEALPVDESGVAERRVARGDA